MKEGVSVATPSKGQSNWKKHPLQNITCNFHCVKTQLIIITTVLAMRTTSFGSKAQVIPPAKPLHW